MHYKSRRQRDDESLKLAILEVVDRKNCVGLPRVIEAEILMDCRLEGRKSQIFETGSKAKTRVIRAKPTHRSRFLCGR